MGLYTIPNGRNKIGNLNNENKDSVYLIYGRKYTDSGLSRWAVLCSSEDNFNVENEKITILCDNILSINIEGVKITKNVSELWLMHNGRMERSYSEERKERLHWVKISYAGEFKKEMF